MRSETAAAALAALLLLAAVPCSAAGVFAENFDSLGPVNPGDDGPSTLITDGWIFRNQSDPASTGTWSDSIAPPYPAKSGTGYLSVRSDSAEAGGAISQWAVMPAVANQEAGDRLIFWTRARTSGQYDLMEVRYSPGGGTSTGSGVAEVGDFTDVLENLSPVPAWDWVRYELTLPGPGRVAFRFMVDKVSQFGVESYVGIDNVGVNLEPSPNCNWPPIPAAGQTVTWDAAGSPWEICENTTIPAGGTVLLEPGSQVHILASYLLTDYGTIRGAGTAADPILFRGEGVFPAAAQIFGTLDLQHAETAGQIIVSTGADVFLADSAIRGPLTTGSSSAAERPPFVRIERTTFDGLSDGFLNLWHTFLLVRDTILEDSYFQSYYSYPLLDNVSVLRSPYFGMDLGHDDQPVFLDNITISGSAGTGLNLSGSNRSTDYLLGTGVVLEDNEVPVTLAGAGLLPGSSVPAAGNRSNYVLWNGGFGARGSVSFAKLAVPYVVLGEDLSLSGGAVVYPGVTFKLGPGVGISVSGAVRARGRSYDRIHFERFDPRQAWRVIALETGSQLEHCVVEGGQYGVASSHVASNVQSCVFANNEVGVWGNSSGMLFVGNSSFVNNGIGARSDSDSFSGNPGLNVSGAPNPNSFSGNAIGATADITTHLSANDDWWGDASGPAAPDNPLGVGDEVLEGVDYRPFLTAEPTYESDPPFVEMNPLFFLQEPGSRSVISWNIENPASVTSQSIYLSSAGNYRFDQIIAFDLPPDQRAFEWTVPDIGFQVNGEPAYIRVVATDSSGQEGFDDQVLQIPVYDFAGYPVITSQPEGTYRGGDPAQVCFDLVDTDFSYAGTDAYLFLDGDNRVIGEGGRSGPDCIDVSLGLPMVSTDTARVAVRMRGSCCNRVKWTFGDCFAIRPDPRMGDAPPSVELLAPLAGEIFAPGSVIPLSWDASDDEGVRSFDVQVSWDGARTWNYLARDLPGSARSWDWQTAPGDGFEDVRVRLIVKDLRFQNSSSGCYGTSIVVRPSCDSDGDGDGYGDGSDPNCPHGGRPDCNDADGTVWGTPGEARSLRFVPGPAKDTFTWKDPLDPGGRVVHFDVLRTRNPADFQNTSLCLETDDVDRAARDPELPGMPTSVFYYLPRARNSCAEGLGPLGVRSDLTARVGRTCP